MKVVLIGIIALIVVIAFSNPLYVGGTGIGARIAAAFLIVVFGFLFVTVSSRLTGEIGSSSNPISGMTVATLLLTCLVFVLLGWTGSNYFVTALSIGGIVCIASSNGGTTSQDLKTGFLIGATPRNQQISILIGALFSALMLGPILLELNKAGSVYVPVNNPPAGYAAGKASPNEHVDVSRSCTRESFRAAGEQATAMSTSCGTVRIRPAATPKSISSTRQDGWCISSIRRSTAFTRPCPTARRLTKFDAPKATLMSYIIKGILGGKLPWGLVLLGAIIAIVLEMSTDSFAGLRGRRLPAALVIEPDLHRRNDPLARRCLGSEKVSRDEPHGRATRRGGRQESGRADGVGLHRGRRNRRESSSRSWPASHSWPDSTTRSKPGRRPIASTKADPRTSCL